MEIYKKVNVIGDEGFTFCVKADNEMTDKEIVLKCTDAGLLSKDDIKECDIVIEDITDDPFEMSVWKNDAEKI